MDAGYARRTPFGRNVAHGVAGVLAALGEWAQGRRLWLEHLTARFHKPLLAGDDYALDVSEEGGEVGIEIQSAGGEAHATLAFGWRRRGDEAEATFAPFTPLIAAQAGAAGGRTRHDRVAYAPDLDARHLAALGLAPGQLPTQQLAGLAWSSYVVGMEVPGRDALLASIDLRFSAASPEPFHLRDVEVRVDDRFARATIAGAGVGIERLDVIAYRRPAPVDHDLESVRAAMAGERRFAGQTVLVTGSSRGFGATLARAFAVAGARVALSARASSSELDGVAADVAACGTAPRVLLGDVSDPGICAQLADAVGALDVLVNNAIAPIPSETFLAQPGEAFDGFVSATLALVAAPCRAFLPRLAPGARVVNVSSSYAREPQPRLGAYVAAKGAVEGLTRVLALEHPELRFVVVRPPRMLTDQTNALVKAGPMASAVDLAARLVARLADLPTGGGLFEVDL
jgi:NAD(P)-dependent dehydrogenase (short-subunit alcohol dehydrogenase family)